MDPMLHNIRRSNITLEIKTMESMLADEKFAPKVSIVIPVYNGSNYLKQAIDSAVAQTYKNKEIIVVNDGSSDGGKTGEIARCYGDKIRYFEKQNGGCASALNLGITQMTGEYFSWLSHDDLYYPTKIEHQIDVLRKTRSKDTILYAGYELIDEKSRSLGFVRPESIIPKDKLDLPLFALLRGLIHGCSLLIPKKYFDTIGLFNEKLPSTQDYDLWFRIFRVAQVKFVDGILIGSRVHSDQGTHKIPKHVEECNDLWSGFLCEITPEEMTALEGSPYLFYKKTAEFLEKTPYTKARDLASTLAKKVFESTKVSVVIPFRNRIGWTLESARSALSQTHSCLEVILVDDGSTDDISSILDLCKLDTRVKYLKGLHRGPASARNIGVAHAEGEYIAFLDSDDLFLPDKVAAQLECMENNQIVISHTSYLQMNAEGDVLRRIDSGRFSGEIFPKILTSCPIAVPTVMAKTTVLKENRFPENIHVGEDVCLWITIASVYGFYGLDRALSKVRVTGESAAFNIRKRALGFSNIRHFLITDSYYRRFHGRRMLLLARSILGTFRLFFRALRIYGLRLTLQKAKQRLLK